jgi:hypothetical protein
MSPTAINMGRIFVRFGPLKFFSTPSAKGQLDGFISRHFSLKRKVIALDLSEGDSIEQRFH